MIEYVSTRNPSIRVRSSKAILDGQAEGGGLYVPSDLSLVKTDYHNIIKGDFRSMAKAVWNIFFDDYGENLIDKLGVDPDEIVNKKMDQNEAKYPVEKAKGKANKYDQL